MSETNPKQTQTPFHENDPCPFVRLGCIVIVMTMSIIMTIIIIITISTIVVYILHIQIASG